MIFGESQRIYDTVAPLAGAWIEIFVALTAYSSVSPVAPLAGAWIEINWFGYNIIAMPRRSPRGSVD